VAPSLALLGAADLLSLHAEVDWENQKFCGLCECVLIPVAPALFSLANFNEPATLSTGAPDPSIENIKMARE